MSSFVCVHDQFHFSHYYWRNNNTFDEDTSTIASEDVSYTVRYAQSGSGPPPASIAFEKPQKQKVVVDDDSIKLHRFYAQVLGDASHNIHFGKWHGIDRDDTDAYGQAASQITDYMFELAMNLLPHKKDSKDISYVDLGSGNGAPAIRIVEQNEQVAAFCLNLCHEQNEAASKRVEESGLSNRITVLDGTYEQAPFVDNKFDISFSQDAFVHAVSKARAYHEAMRITKPGGAFVFCDVVAGSRASKEDIAAFADRNAISDFLTPDQVVETLTAAGWRDVHYINLTSDMRTSFELMLRKVNDKLLDDSSPEHRAMLDTYTHKIQDRLVSIDNGTFQWCVFHARKPVVINLMCETPVPFVNTNELIIESDESVEISAFSSVAVVDILTKMPREKIMALPNTTELLITLSAGLDHIDLEACASRGIAVRQSGRDSITSHVVQYVLAFLILGLREALSQLGVAFPSKGWDLTWNCNGTPLTDSTIAIVGLGVIAKELIDQIRKIAPDTTILYHVPECFRDFEYENQQNVEYCADLKDMTSRCNVLVPLCPLNKHTANLVNADVLACLRPEAGLINMARGKVVDTDALTAALKEKKFRYAILDTTFPEPLPSDHELWNQSNCFILPHYATNTMHVRRALVEEIQPIVQDYFGLVKNNAAVAAKAKLLKEQEETLRYDLAVAHRLTANLGMDMLVWNHISARFQDGCLITPGRKMWGKVTPNDLVFSSSNVTADIIHDAIYGAREDIGAIIHLHTPAATAVSCLEVGFVPMTQDAAYFYKKVANYEWDGVSDDADEGPAIAEAIRSTPGCNTLLMHNHGYVCFGRTVKEAWVLAYYFERCCEVQLRVMQCGGKVSMPPPSVMAAAAETSYLPEFAPGMCEWEALCETVNFD